MADEKMRYSTAVGPLPVLSDPSTWAPAWEREEARMGVADTLTHATFRGIESMRPANPFAKHIADIPHTFPRRPSLVNHRGAAWPRGGVPPFLRRLHGRIPGEPAVGADLRLHPHVPALHRRVAPGRPHDGSADDVP